MDEISKLKELINPSFIEIQLEIKAYFEMRSKILDNSIREIFDDSIREILDIPVEEILNHSFRKIYY